MRKASGFWHILKQAQLLRGLGFALCPLFFALLVVEADAADKGRPKVLVQADCASWLQPLPDYRLLKPVAELNVSKRWIDVGAGHSLYVEESGNPDGKPVVILHGGPGISPSPRMRQFFDPKKYRIISFAQRGTPPSRFEDALKENTTQNLIADMEVIRAALGVEKWQVFGGSWGSTLGLAYAIAHPKRVSELVVYGIYLARKSDNAWYAHAEQNSRTAWPEWKKFHALYRREARPGETLEQTYFRLMTGSDRGLVLEAKRAWAKYGDTVCGSEILTSDRYTARALEQEFQPVIESMYCSQSAFFGSDNYLLDHAHVIAGIPAVIVHGTSDLITPVDAAFALKARLPLATLVAVPGAPHGSIDAKIISALRAATELFKENP